MNKAQFSGKVFAAQQDTVSLHPLQSRLDFIFTDFSPNINKQGVPIQEAENIIRTALNMPVKVNLMKGKAGGHDGAIPIGPITNIELKEDKIIGHAIVWKDEFPDVIQFIEKATAEEDSGVQFSWELYYKESDTDENGIDWLRGVVVAGTTIVDNPAYNGRTYLLSFAEEKRNMELEEKIQQLEEQLQQASDRITNAETAVAQAQADLASEREAREAAESELNTMKATQARAELLSTRRATLAEAGVQLSDEAFAEQEGFLAEMSEDLFTQYVKNVTVLVKNSAQAGVEKKATSEAETIIPDPLHTSVDKPINISTIAQELRKRKN